MNFIKEENLLLEKEVFARESIEKRMKEGGFNSFSKTEDVTVTVTYGLNSYDLTVNYVDAEGNQMVDANDDAIAAYTETVGYGSSYSVLSPVVTGYTADQLSVTGTMGTENLIITVVYSINTYTVEFLDYNGTPLSEPQTVEYGSAAQPPVNPSRSGYTFTGWSPVYNNVTTNLDVVAQYTLNPVPATPGTPATPTPTPTTPTPTPTTTITPGITATAATLPPSNIVIDEAPVALARAPRAATPVAATVEEEEEVVEATDEVTQIEDEDTALADDVTEIAEEETPLAVPVENCMIHWLILLLTAAYTIYEVVRGVARRKKINELTDSEAMNKSDANA